jgi:cell division septation protein DedD
MKKSLILGFAIVSALAFVSCKSSESSYKKAYEKAKAQEQTQQATEPVTATPVPVVKPVETIKPVEEDNSDLRKESLTSVNGGSLNPYNVVCGSFKSLDNANNLCSTLKNKGYSAIVAQNPSTGMYRVIASSTSSKSEAVSTRDKLRSTYPDAWLLYAQ